MAGEMDEEQSLVEVTEGVLEDRSSPWKNEWDLEEEFEEYSKTQYLAGEMDLEEVLEALSWQTVRLMKRARIILDGYWLMHLKENKKRRLSDKSVMGCRARIKGNSLYLEWYFDRWVQTKEKKNKPLSTTLKRGKGYLYKPAVLLKHAQPWETQFILGIEKDFAAIRRQNRFLALARNNIREAIKSRDKLSVADN